MLHPGQILHPPGKHLFYFTKILRRLIRGEDFFFEWKIPHRKLTSIMSRPRYSKLLRRLGFFFSIFSKMKSSTRLPGLGMRTASVFLTSFSVHTFVHSALSYRFSKCESNSVFSEVPSFSSVNYYFLRVKKNKQAIKRVPLLRKVSHFALSPLPAQHGIMYSLPPSPTSSH